MTKKKKLDSMPLTVSILFFLILGSCVASAGTETRLTHGALLTDSTAIYDNIVTWSETAGNAVHVYDLAAGKEMMSIGTAWGGKIPVYGNKIVWAGMDENVILYDISTNNWTTLSSDGSFPDIYGNYVVYTNNYYSQNRQSGIYLYDLNTHNETRIAAVHSYPAIYDKIVVWSQANSSNGYDICTYDISTHQTSTIWTINSSSFESQELDIYGNVVVWTESDNVYMYDMASHKTTQVTNGENVHQPAIYGKRIVYAVGKLYSGDIYTYDISTAKTTRITTSTRAFSPSIYDDKIVYVDSRDSEYGDARDIYLYDLSSTVQNPPVAAFTANITSGTAPLAVLFLDTSTGGTPTSWYWDFGDGIDSKHAMNATHIFTNPGMYNVTLIVANEAGNSTVTKPNCITVTPPQAPVADFAMPNNPIVYGFWPNWPYLESYQPDWNTLTHVSYSEWTLNSDGTLTDPGNMSHYYAVRDQAHQHGVNITLCIYSSDPYVMDSVIANHQTDFINNVSNSLQMYGADGVNLDLETPTDVNSITGASNAPLFENLMANLHTTLKAENPAYHISLDIPWGIKQAATFKNANLKKYVDSVFLMSYDYCNRKATAPNSPYDSPIRYDAIDSVNETSKYFSKNQIILGLPFYGYDYSTDSNQPGANITNERAVHIEDAINNSQIYGRIWDSDSNTPWYFYKAGNTWHQVWYDDDQSLRLKYQYAKSENLRGVGFWALGYEGNHSNIWKVFQLDPVADFSTSVTSGYTPLSVQFTDLSQHAILRNWNFGDGVTSTEQNPSHTYCSAGTYIVNLTTGNGNNTASKTATITVFEESSSSGGSSGSSHSSSGGGGSGGGSPELQSNVQVKEISQAAVINGKSVKFDFIKNATCVVYVSFDAKKTFGKTTTIAEQLKLKSSLVSGLPEGEVYKSFNVWVGNGGIATSKNIENPVVCFKVEKSWVKDKNIDQDSITLNRYNNEKWEQFPVCLSGEDNKFLYFTAETSGFSSFSITGTAKLSSKENVTEVRIGYPETINNNTENREPHTQKNEILSTPSFSIYYGIASLFALLLYKRK